MAADSSSGNMSGSNAFSYGFGNSVTIDNNSEETHTFGVEQLQHLFKEQQRFLDYFFKNLNYEQVCCHLLLLLLLLSAGHRIAVNQVCAMQIEAVITYYSVMWKCCLPSL
jgi:hypothetical protein